MSGVSKYSKHLSASPTGSQWFQGKWQFEVEYQFEQASKYTRSLLSIVGRLSVIDNF